MGDDIERLVREGRPREAAEVCRERGEWLRAAELFADAWAFREAADAAERGERLDLAYRYALAADDRESASRLRDALVERAPAEQLESAARFAEARGRFGDAARFAERAGDVEGAATFYERATEWMDAGRTLELLGRARDAGRAYEQRTREVPDDGAAQLALGRVLARFGQHEAAVRALQRAVLSREQRGPALRLMVACLDALGLADAAATRLDELHESDPTLPVTVAEYLLESFGSDRGAAALGAEGDGQLLAGRYRVLRALGAGATGRVVLARDVFFDRDVAVKALTVGDGSQGRDALARFAREARIAAAIEHPNVVRVFDFDPAGPFLVMEHLAGGTLEDRLVAGHPIAPRLARLVTLALLDALAAVHRRGVVHRDLKPANVFFDATGTPKLGDFGVAHLADLGTTLTGAMLGSLATMAPEQITGATPPTGATDLYALGVILFRMLTGVLPFPGPDFVTQHLESPPPLASAIRPALGDAYDALLLALLTKDPGARAHDAMDVRSRTAVLPFSELVDDAPVIAVRADSRPPAGPTEETRYVDEGDAHRDLVLDRRVHVIPCDEALAVRLRELGAREHPNVQAVWDVDPARGRAVLEAVDGVPLSTLRADDPRRHAALAELAALVAAGLTQPPFDERFVIVGTNRTTWLLPIPCRVGV